MLFAREKKCSLNTPTRKIPKPWFIKGETANKPKMMTKGIINFFAKCFWKSAKCAHRTAARGTSIPTHTALVPERRTPRPANLIPDHSHFFTYINTLCVSAVPIHMPKIQIYAKDCESGIMENILKLRSPMKENQELE